MATELYQDHLEQFQKQFIEDYEGDGNPAMRTYAATSLPYGMIYWMMIKQNVSRWLSFGILHHHQAMFSEVRKITAALGKQSEEEGEGQLNSYQN